MTIGELKQANELSQKAKRLNEQLQRVLRVQISNEPFGVYGGHGSAPGVLLEDLPKEARNAVFAVIVNALDTELARTANDLAEM